MYGTDAFSGVVQVFSHRRTTRVPAISVFTEGGRFADVRTGARSADCSAVLIIPLQDPISTRMAKALTTTF